MSVVALLAAGGALAALGTSEAANEDRRSKRALAAAEAGIQQAAYRLSVLRPNQLMCMGAGGAPVARGTGAPPGECPAVTGSVATDARFDYRTTPALGPTEECAGLQGGGTDPTSTEHCITATGTVGNVTRRLQARVRVARGGQFSMVGLLGIEYVRMINSDVLVSDVGSNGLIDGDNSVRITGALRVPDGAPTPTISGSNPPVVRQSTPHQIPPIDFTAIAPPAPNNNAALNGLSGWNSGTRVLAFGNSVNVELPAGTYYLCEMYGDNSIRISLHSNVTPTNPVKIYIDSPTRPGSGCPAGTGRFCLDNSVRFNDGGDAAELAIYIHGTTARCSDARPGMPFDGAHFPSDSAFVLGNSVRFAGTISAPNTRVKLNNSVTVDGAIHALSAELANSVNFTHPASLTNSAAAPGAVNRVSWVECRSQPTNVNDPESGCT